MSAEVGSVLGSRFRLVEALGAGAFGTVYRAADAETGAAVAVKVLHAALADRDDVVDRFETELQIISRLDHPNIAQAIASGIEGDVRWFAMELIEGKTLKQELEDVARTGKFVPLDAIIEITSGIASALEAAHAQGIVHRDLKCANVIIMRRGARPIPKVVDFGIAKITRSVEDQTTRGRRLGTLMYMSPEQLRGETVDHRTDIFSFGVVLFELLTLRRPFVLDHGEPMRLDAEEVPSHENSTFAVMKRIAADDRPVASKFRPELGARADEVLSKALDHFVDRRFGSVQALSDALFDALDDGSTVKRPRPAPDDEGDAIPDTAVETRPTAAPPRRARLPYAVAAAAALLAGALLWPATQPPVEVSPIVPEEPLPSEVPIADAPRIEPRVIEREPVEEPRAVDPRAIDPARPPKPPPAKVAKEESRSRDPRIMRLLAALDRADGRGLSEVASAVEREAKAIEDEGRRRSVERCVAMSRFKAERAEVAKCVEALERGLSE